MNKAVCIFLAVLFIAAAAAGQESTAGLKAGPMLCLSKNERSNTFSEAESILRLKAGIFYARKISSVFSIQPEVYFAPKGVLYFNPFSHAWESFYFSYLELPLLLSARVAGGILEFFAGPYAALIVSHTHRDEGFAWYEGMGFQEKNLKHYDFGTCHGLRVWWHDWSFEIQFLHGFINIFPRDESSYYNTALVFQVGYRLFK